MHPWTKVARADMRPVEQVVIQDSPPSPEPPASTTRLATTVLHVVGGNDPRGGVMSFVRQIASVPVPKIRHLVWKSRDFRDADSQLFVCQGRVRLIDVNATQDFVGAARDSFPLYAWCRRHRSDLLLCAHSRMGIILAAIIRLVTGIPAMIHLHAQARQTFYYRLLKRRIPMIFNSRNTCLHYGFNPQLERIVPPSIVWPEKPNTLPGSPRFAACSAFVPVKNIDLIIDAFERLPGGRPSLVIWGASDPPLDAVYQSHILKRTAGNGAIDVRQWSFDWLAHLSDRDIFVHLRRSEPFGIVILEAFASGCRLVVPAGTFLDDLPEPGRSAGIFRCHSVSPPEVASQLMAASQTHFEAGELWQLRRSAASQFSNAANAAKLAHIYRSVQRSLTNSRT